MNRAGERGPRPGQHPAAGDPPPRAPGPDADDDADGPIGPFNSWRALYATVIGYALALIFILLLLTRLLDFSVT